MRFALFSSVRPLAPYRMEHYHQHDHSAYRYDQNARQIDTLNTGKAERLEDRATDRRAMRFPAGCPASPSPERFTIWLPMNPPTSPTTAMPKYSYRFSFELRIVGKG